MLYRNRAGYIDASLVVISTGAALTAGTVYAFAQRTSDSKWLWADQSWNAVKPTTTDIPTLTHVSGGLWKLAHAPANIDDYYFLNCIDSGATCYQSNYEMQVVSLVRRTTPAYAAASMVAISTGAPFISGTVHAFIQRASDSKWLWADLSWNAVKPTTTDIPVMTHVSGGEWKLAIAAPAADDIYFVNCIDDGATCYPDNYVMTVLDMSPGNPVRQQIVDAIAVRMATITTANGYRTDVGANIFHWKAGPFLAGEVPGMDIRDNDTFLDDTVGEQEHTLDINLRCITSGDASPETIRSIVADVTEAVRVDLTWDMLADDTGPITDETIDVETADAVRTGCGVKFAIVYTAARFTV